MMYYSQEIYANNMAHSNPIDIQNNDNSQEQDLYLLSCSPQIELLNNMNNLHIQNSPESLYLYENNLKRSNSMPIPKKPLPIKINKLTNKKSNTEYEHKKSNHLLDSESYRKKLDEKLAKINFDDITVAELKETLRERGLSANGRKAELMNRLMEEYNLVVIQKNPNILLNRRMANLSLKKPFSPKITYHPYHHPLSSSLPTNNYNLPILDEQYQDFNMIATSVPNNISIQPNINYGPVKIEEDIDIWDDQMLQNFLNNI